MDHGFIEQLWRSLKHEDVSLKGYADGLEARLAIAVWMEVYNGRRRHPALGSRAPMALWREAIARARAVAMRDNASALPLCPKPQQQKKPLPAGEKEKERPSFQRKARLKWSRFAPPFHFAIIFAIIQASR